MPSFEPTTMPTGMPTAMPSFEPTTMPTGMPTTMPTEMPTTEPTGMPSFEPTTNPTGMPTLEPTANYPTVVTASVEMEGLNAEEWISDHTTAFEKGVEDAMEAMTGTTVECTVDSVTDATDSARRRAATDSVQVDFTVTTAGN